MGSKGYFPIWEVSAPGGEHRRLSKARRPAQEHRRSARHPRSRGCGAGHPAPHRTGQTGRPVLMLLLDTNVVSELRKVRFGIADTNVAKWSETLDTADLFISAVTIHELAIGVLLAERRDPPQGAVFRQWLERQVMSAF